MSSYVISCCSTADLTEEHFSKREISYICFHYKLNDTEYADDLGKSMPFDQFYAAMAAGGRVTGIIPRVFIEKEQAHRGITELLEVPDMITRKQKLIESGDAFIVLPGGIGTLEELADTFSHYRIYAAPGSRPPILIANINGIYDPLKALFQNWLRLGFIEKEDLSSIHFCSSLEEIMKILGK